MLSETQLNQYCHGLSLSDVALSYIKQMRSSGPSRKVRCGTDNMTARYPSRKMAGVVAVESHTVELAFAYLCEHDPDVLEYWPQPPPTKLCYSSAKGQRLGVIHTPDFFVLTKSEAGWVECKPEERLVELAVTQPNRYRRDAQSRWRCPPGEESGAEMGFFYRVWSSADTHPNVIRNLRFLEDYLFPDYPEVPEDRKQVILDFVKMEPGITLSNLVSKGAGGSFEDVYALIGKQALHVELKDAPISHVDRVRVFQDEQTSLEFRIAKATARDKDVCEQHSIAASNRLAGDQVFDIAQKPERSTPEGEAILRNATRP